MSKVKPTIGIFSLFALFLLSPLPSFAVNLDRMVEEIRIEGLDPRRNEHSKVLHSQQRGAESILAKPSRKISDVYSSLGYFDNIEVDANGDKIRPRDHLPVH